MTFWRSDAYNHCALLSRIFKSYRTSSTVLYLATCNLHSTPSSTLHQIFFKCVVPLSSKLLELLSMVLHAAKWIVFYMCRRSTARKIEKNIHGIFGCKNKHALHEFKNCPVSVLITPNIFVSSCIRPRTRNIEAMTGF